MGHEIRDTIRRFCAAWREWQQTQKMRDALEGFRHLGE